MKIMTIGDVLKEDKHRVLTLDELAGVNLAQTWVTSAQLTLTVQKGEDLFLKITRPTRVRSQFNPKELESLEQLLRELCLRYTVTYHPPFFLGEWQRKWWATLEVMCVPFHQATIVLVDIDMLYSKIVINGVPVLIGHGGGTSAEGWVARTDGFKLEGSDRNRMRAIKSLITCLGRKG